MEDNKLKAGFVCGEWDEYAYLCYHRNEHWNGWAMPYFRLKEAKAIAKELKGTYNKDKDAFVFTNDGEEDIYEATTIEVRGRKVKVYPIGTGYWCWDLANELKIYSAFWGDSFYNGGTKKVVDYFFSEDRCYSKEDIAAINALEISATWTSNDYGPEHTVTRVN